MKKCILLLFSIACYAMISCNQEVNSVYSCDKMVNEWAKSNLEEIQTMSRTDWNLLDEEKKRAAYRVFSFQQRICLWEEKFNEIRNMNWSEEELKHIEKAYSFLMSHLSFLSDKELSDEESDELHRFCYLWIKEGMEKIGWTEEIPLSIIATCNSLQNKEGEIIIRTPLPFVDEPSETPNCNCHANNLFFHMCGANSSCDDTDCDGASNGCGFFWTESCNGRCY